MLTKEKEITFPRRLGYKDLSYTVNGYMGEGTRYIDGKCYVNPDNGYVYLYTEETPLPITKVPLIYQTIEGDILRKTLDDSVFAETFNIENTYSIEYDHIVGSTTGKEKLYNEEALNYMNSANSSYKPVIEENDDPLKKIVKKILIDRNIDTSSLKHKMDKEYQLSNLIASLKGPTKTSITAFNIWMELLDVEYQINVGHEDTYFIEYSSQTGKLSSSVD